jgi:hypothetical protein
VPLPHVLMGDREQFEKIGSYRGWQRQLMADFVAKVG